tara:strand:- start:1226 stop:1648 length:423 start_codon:yes stop_codon:yes gene_type:complete
MKNMIKSRKPRITLSILHAVIFAVSLSCLSIQAQELGTAQTSFNNIHPKYALKQINIQAVDFDQLTIREALEILTIKIEHQTNKQITPNFIIRDLKGAFKNRTVTMQLKNMPANTLLEYIANQVGGSIRYDRHAIIISPR